MSKGSTRRPCQISREEETLRWKLALGEIPLDVFNMKMKNLEITKDSKGVCGNCMDGLMVGETTFQPDYKIQCRIDSTVHHQWDTCSKFREEK